MKYKVKLNGEEHVAGATPREVVEALMALELTERKGGIRRYMDRASKRVRVLKPATRIRTSRADLFLQDMCAAGFLEEEEEP